VFHGMTQPLNGGSRMTRGIRRDPRFVLIWQTNARPGRAGQPSSPRALRAAVNRPPGELSLITLSADVQEVLTSTPGQTRQMLGKLFAGHRIKCHPAVAENGTRGYHFKTTGTYAALLGWGAPPTVVSPTGLALYSAARTAWHHGVRGSRVVKG